MGRLTAFAAVLFGIVIWTEGAHAQSAMGGPASPKAKYQVIDLGSSRNNIFVNINNRNEVCGESFEYVNGRLKRNALVVAIKISLKGRFTAPTVYRCPAYSWIIGQNNRGQRIGFIHDGKVTSQARAVIFTNRGITPLKTQGTPLVINDQGTVAGTVLHDQLGKFVIYREIRGGKKVAVEYFNDVPGLQNGRPTGIANDGTVSVVLYDIFEPHAALWGRSGEVLPLGNGQANDINDGGTLVGQISRQATQWQSTQPVPLGVSDTSEALAVNNQGQIVGRDNGRGFLFTGANGVVYLDDVTKLPQGGFIGEAKSINDKGYILCDLFVPSLSGGYEKRYAVLSPIWR